MDSVHDFPSSHGTKTSKSQKRLHKTKPSPAKVTTNLLLFINQPEL